MRTIESIMLITLLTFVGRAQAQTLNVTVGDMEIEAGKTAEMKVSLENSMDIAGWQLYLYLPEHIDIAYEEEDGERYYDNTVKLSSRHLHSHTCSITATDDGGYLIMGYNPSKPTNIKDHNGEIVSIVLKAADTFKGHQTGTIMHAAVSDIYAVQTNVDGDVTFRLVLPGELSGVSGVSADSDSQPVYHINGQHATEKDKGVMVRKGQKYVAK